MSSEPSLDAGPSRKKIGPKTIALFLFKLLGTTVFLYWAFSQMEDQSALAENFRLALTSPFWLGCGIAFAGITVLTSALRWHVLLRAQSIDVSFSYIGKLTLIAALFNVASFGTAAGDAMKMISVMRRYPDKKVVITMTVMIDHMVGFISGGLIFLVFAWAFGTVQATENFGVRQAFIATTVFQAVGIFFIVVMYLISSDRMLEKFGGKMPKMMANKHIQSITSSLNCIRSSWKALTVSLAASFALSASYFLAFYAGLQTIGEDVAVSTIFTVMPIVDVVSALPISISGLGVRERAFDFLVSELAGIATSSAVSASLIGFLFHVFWGVVGGIYLIFDRSAFAKHPH
ncbi:flippase-like domain-containing protein [Verrucomicrobiaceae bacterium R5-34]|nr:flippase-like domain-containing protein [Verrucomicrobiaceae bacterium R5-34]